MASLIGPTATTVSMTHYLGHYGRAGAAGVGLCCQPGPAVTQRRRDGRRPGFLGAREPLLEGCGERRIAVHLDAVFFWFAATHQHPVEALGASAHRDVGFGMAGLS